MFSTQHCIKSLMFNIDGLMRRSGETYRYVVKDWATVAVGHEIVFAGASGVVLADTGLSGYGSALLFFRGRDTALSTR